MAFDLVIKGGRVIDPAQAIDETRDVAFAGGNVAEIARDIPAEGAARGENCDLGGEQPRVRFDRFSCKGNPRNGYDECDRTNPSEHASSFPSRQANDLALTRGRRDAASASSAAVVRCPSGAAAC